MTIQNANSPDSASVARGIQYIKNIQRDDGSWHGSWAVCYTYAIWFGVLALVAVGEGNGPEVDKALKFLREKQSSDGSWGEDFKACVQRKWVDNPLGGQTPHTAWALLSLMAAERPEDADIVKKGIQWLIRQQEPNGDWANGSIVGVFNFNCAIAYEGYKNYFPIWALGNYMNSYKYGSDFAL